MHILFISKHFKGLLGLKLTDILFLLFVTKAEDAALQKQVNHTEKLHGVTTQQATTTLQRQAVSENINNLYVLAESPA